MPRTHPEICSSCSRPWPLPATLTGSTFTDPSPGERERIAKALIRMGNEMLAGNADHVNFRAWQTVPVRQVTSDATVWDAENRVTSVVAEFRFPRLDSHIDIPANDSQLAENQRLHFKVSGERTTGNPSTLVRCPTCDHYRDEHESDGCSECNCMQTSVSLGARAPGEARFIEGRPPQSTW